MKGADRGEADNPDLADRVQDRADAETGDEQRRDRHAGDAAIIEISFIP